MKIIRCFGVLWMGGVLCGLPAGAQDLPETWRTQSASESFPVRGLHFQTLVARRGQAAIQLDWVQFSTRQFELLVIDNGKDQAKPSFGNLARAMEASGCVAGTNGGFFDEALFRPDGLQVANGIWTGFFDPKHGSRGVFVVRNGKASLEQCDECRVDASVQHLLQSGLVLAWDGAASPILNDRYPSRRTFIAWDGMEGWILGQASRCGLKQLGGLLSSKTFRKYFTLKQALCLDGGSSSGFWVGRGRGGGAAYNKETATVRNFIGIRAKP